MRIAMLAGAAVALALIAAFWLFGSAPTPPAVVSAVADRPLPQRFPSLGSMGGSGAVRASTAAPAPSVAASGAAALPLAAGQTEVCGAGPMPADGIGYPELAPAWALRAELAQASLAADLEAAAEPRLRAVGLLLQQTRATQAASQADDVDARQLRCGNDRACNDEAARRAATAWGQAGASSAAALATLAAGSRDPAVYAAALRACQPLGLSTELRADACQLVSTAQWARIDADNAVPWLHMAAAAAARRDGPGLDEAMHRVAAATASRTYGDVLAGVAIEQAGDAGDFNQTQMAQAAIGIAAGWPLPDYLTATRYCNAAALRDGNRMQTCDQIARGLVARPSSFIEFRVGVAIAERLGWPAPALAALQERSAGYRQAMTLVYAGPNPYGCAAHARARAFWLDTARRGELAAVESVLASAAGPPASASRPAR